MQAFLLALAVLAAFLLGAALDLSLPPQEVCEQAAKSGQDRCTAQLHSLYLFFKLLEALNIYGPFLTVLGTGVIAWFTWSLTNSTRKQWQVARIAAAAAQQSADTAKDAFSKLERPYVYVFDVLPPAVFRGRAVTQQPVVRYSVANYGKTPATIISISAGVSVQIEPEVPIDADFDHDLYRRPILPPNDKRDVEVECAEGIADFDLIPTQVAQILGPETLPEWQNVLPKRVPGSADFFMVWVIINYRGPFTGSHKTSSCWHYDHRTGSFRRHGGQQYNYEN